MAKTVRASLFWHDARKENPPENGRYLIIVEGIDGEPKIQEMPYFNGWNKSSDDDTTEIEVMHGSCRYILFWAKMNVDRETVNAMFEACKE